MKIWAYFLENTSDFYCVDNSPLFKEIQELGIGEDEVYIDEVSSGEQIELKKLLDVASRGDTILIRSIADLGRSGADIVSVLQQIERMGVDVASMGEVWYDGKRTLPYVERIMAITVELAERKRRLGMERARDEGRLGRKMNTEKQTYIRKLKEAGLAPKDVCEIVGVSRSTFYRCR